MQKSASLEDGLETDFWTRCLQRLQTALPAQQFATWIQVLNAELIEDAIVPSWRIIAPNSFVQQWVKNRYHKLILDVAADLLGESFDLKFVLATETKPLASIPQTVAVSTRELPVRNEIEQVTQTDFKNADITSTRTKVVTAVNLTQSNHSTSQKPAVQSPKGSPVKGPYAKTHLNSNFTFENLVTGKANNLAQAAAQQVAQNPGGAYNPLFIYGGVGLGKTHLVHAIGNAIFDEDPSKVVLYVHVEDYYADVVRAYRQKNFDQFKQYYRSLDVLIIDDIQFFNRKTRTQEEFFHAFNALTESHKQVIITCDTYPKDIQGLEDRLISRFDWGLTVQIEPPELEMRVAILEKKAELLNVQLPAEVAFLIAKNLRSNVRELEGALNKVVAYCRFHGKSIHLEAAKDALKDLMKAYNRQLTVDHIQKTVADYYKIKVSDMFSKKRTRNIARPRQIAMSLTKELTPMSLPSIGDAFGGRDHTTVLHACRTIEELRQQDSQLNHDVHVLLQVLKG